MSAKLNRAELMVKVTEIVRSRTNDPAEELIAMGKALQEIGEALRELSPGDSRAVLMAVRQLQ